MVRRFWVQIKNKLALRVNVGFGVAGVGWVYVISIARAWKLVGFVKPWAVRTRVWRVFCVWAGQEGRGGWVFPLHLGFLWVLVGLGDGGFVPGVGVGFGGFEDSGLEGCGSGGEADLVFVGAELNASDAVDFS